MNKIDPMTIPYFGWWECKVCGQERVELASVYPVGDDVELIMECGHRLKLSDIPDRQELPT